MSIFTVQKENKQYSKETKIMNTTNYEHLKELMDSQITYKFDGYTFDEWLSMNDGTKGGYVCWVCDFKSSGQTEKMRELWDKMDATIKVGVPCTIHYYSDHRAATITEVIKNKAGKVIKVGVKRNVTKTLDYYAGDYEIKDELEGGERYYTLRRNHRWIEEGSTSKDPSTILSIGFRRHYIDPSF